MTFTDLLRATGRSPRVLAYQLRRLMGEGLAYRRRRTDPADRRSRFTYEADRAWPWAEQHRGVLAAVAHAVTESVVFPGLTAGAETMGREHRRVHTSLIVERRESDGTLEYPRGAVNMPKVRAAVTALREALDGEARDGYHWQYLLTMLITETVTWQRRSFFLIAYPAACARPRVGPDGTRLPAWPAPDWNRKQGP